MAEPIRGNFHMASCLELIPVFLISFTVNYFQRRGQKTPNLEHVLKNLLWSNEESVGRDNYGNECDFVRV